MSRSPALCIYLPDGLLQNAQAGKHNFIAILSDTVRDAGFDVTYRKYSPSDRWLSAGSTEYSMFHMEEPEHDRALTFRRLYHYPFWAIEPTARRWDWHVAKTAFPAQDVPRQQANWFYGFWQKRLFGEAPQNVSRDGFVYAPLQGKLTEFRSFQTCSPLAMLEQILEHDPDRRIVVTLHPGEQYSSLELTMLEKLISQHDRMVLSTASMESLLAGCDYVACQNSGVAFNGYFFRKPAVLFSRCEFHHIAANVPDLGAKEAIRRAPELAPDFPGYVHWFWQIMGINAGRDDARDKIRAALLRAGWPI
jgi:hypothetical protein